MQIDVLSIAQEANPQRIGTGAVVVIDVLRATSVIATALHHGAQQVIPVMTPEEAFAQKTENRGVWLGGERNAVKIEGFDCGNSPLEYVCDEVAGKTIVMTTTNGTLALIRSASAPVQYIGSFLNAAHLVQLLGAEQEICMVCAGTDGSFTLEDALCAGYLIYLLMQDHRNVELTDIAWSHLMLYLSSNHDVVSVAQKGKHYRNLMRLGLHADLKYCFELNRNFLTPVCRQGVIRLWNPVD